MISKECFALQQNKNTLVLMEHVKSCSNPIGPVMTGYYNVPQGDEENLADTVENMGPVATAIDASNWSFQLYSEGIYDEPSCSSYSIDHGVSIIGFGKENEVKYWIVRDYFW